MKAARRHRHRIRQWAVLALEGVLDPRVQAAAAVLRQVPPALQAVVLLAALQGLAYLPESGEQLATVAQVLDRGGDDCDGLATVAVAIALAAGLPAQLEMYRKPGDVKATHVAARVAGELVDPTPPAPWTWQLSGPGPLPVCLEGCA